MKPWASVAERTALFLTVAAVLLRWIVPGSTAGTGTNLLLHSFFWIALGLWFAAGALRGGADWRFSGAEFPLIAFAIVALLSAQRASHKLPAFEQAIALLSFSLLAVLAVQVLGRETLLSILLPALPAFGLAALWQYFVDFPQVQAEMAGKPMTEELRRRLASREVFATFIGPNQFAAVLCFLLPLAAGALLDAQGRPRWTLAAGLAAGAVALFLTGSLGGWAALAAGAAAFAGLALTRKRGRAAFVGAAGAAAAVVVALLMFGPLLDLLSRNFSMQIRAVYWRAAGKIAASAPVLGVGMDNFQEHYLAAKSDAPQETMRVHNDYLQIQTDAGALGLLAFAALLAWGLRRACAREEVPSEPRPPPGLVASSGAVALLWPVAQGHFSLIVFAAGWLGAWFLLRGHRPAGWTRIGAAAGLVAMLVHLMVDFVLYEFGSGMTLFLALALAGILQGRVLIVRIPGKVCTAAALALLIPGTLFLAWLAPSAQEADAALRAAQHATDAFAIRRARDAQAANPLQFEAFQVHAQEEFDLWRRAARAGAGTAELAPGELTIVEAFRAALRLRPRASNLWWELADLERRFHRHHRGGNPVQAEAHLQQALGHQRRALELYPTLWRNPYAMARLLDLAGRGDEALPHYRETLRLGERAAAEKWATDRFRPTPLAQARCLLRLGRADDARLTLEQGLRTRPEEELEDERDETTGPVIDAALKAIMTRP